MTDKFLDKIAELNGLSEIDQNHVEKALGTKLRPDPAHSNEFFKFFVSSKESQGQERPVHSVDYRVAVGGASTKRILLVVEPGDWLKLRASDVISRFGEPGEVEALPPPAGRESSVYVYKNSYGELRFGIMPGQEQGISSVVIDRTE